MKAYTVNNHLVGVGNSQILGTDQGGGGGVEYEAGQYISIDENNVISVTGVAPATALPTTEFGKFTIQNNVSGGLIEVLVPTDQGHVVYDVIMDSDSVSGTYETGGYRGVLFKSPGYDNDYWNYTAGTVTMHVPEAVTGIAYIYACYAYNSSPTSGYSTGPNFFSDYPWRTPDQSTYILQPGNYEIATITNAVPEYGGYGKYISIVAGGPGPDVNALSKISFAGMDRHPELGYDVNLDRYYLGNTDTITSTSGYTQAVIYTDPNTKKQTVYLPDSMPTGWSSDIIQSLQYGNNYASPSVWGYDTKQYRAYKYTSSPERYQFAYCTDLDDANKVMTFIAYDNSGNAIEKWTLNYSTWGTSVWTTTEIETGVEYEAGDYISIASGTISVTGVAPASAIPAAQVNSDWNANSGVAEILNKPDEIQLIAGTNVQVEVTGASAIISAQGGGGGTTYEAGQYIAIDSNDVISVTGLQPAGSYATETYVQNYSIPVQVVATSAAATGNNILYVVTGS